MTLDGLITPESVAPALRASSKKLLPQELANRVAETEKLDARTVFDALMERERLGPTGMGRGVAIPHARLGGVAEVRGFFARLERGVDFDAPDGAPVDLAFLLLAPEDAGADHLRALAKVSRVFRQSSVRDALRAARTEEEVRAVVCQETAEPSV